MASLVLAVLLLAGCHELLPYTASSMDAGGRDVDRPDRGIGVDGRPLADRGAERLPVPDLLAPDMKSPPLFEDDFSTGTKLKDDGSGAWSTSGGQYHAADCWAATPDAWVPGASWGDVRVSAQVKIDQVCLLAFFGEAGLIGRVTSATGCTNRYYFCAVATAGDLTAGRRDSDCEGTNYAQTKTTIAEGVWYSLELVITGSAAGATKVVCTIVGAGVTVTYVDAETPYGSGSAGVFARDAKASFDDLKVELP